MTYHVVILGGGPGGLSAALALGRARRRVLVCDGGPRRNAAAVHLHNFLGHDGTPPTELRRLARAQLARYPSVELRDAAVEELGGEVDAFELVVGAAPVRARRVLLTTGMLDEPLAIPGADALWGTSIVQCPYCHGWEVQDRRWGFLVLPAAAGHLLPFALQALTWTSRVTVFTAGALPLADEVRGRLAAAGVALEEAPIARLVADGGALREVALADGRAVPCDVLFAHPPQRQVELVRRLGLALDGDGYVVIDPVRRETSRPGVYAAGDLTTRMQGAILAAAAGTQAAAMINVDLAMSPGR